MPSKQPDKQYGVPPEIEAQRLLDKPLPSSPESEGVILGAILLDNSVADEVAIALQPGDFYSPLNRRIFSAMLSLMETGKQIDPITIGEVLKVEGSLETVGKISAITNLTRGLPHFSAVAEYIATVKDKAMLRDLIRRCNKIQDDALSEEFSASQVVDLAEALILEVDVQVSESRFKPMGEIADRVIDRAQKIAHGELDMLGLMTGFTDLDAMTQGLQPSDLVIIAGRPSMGKTTLAVDIGRHVAFEQGKNAAMFSMEMADEQLATRVLCSEADLKGHRLRAATLTQEEWARLAQARERVNGGRFLIDETPLMTAVTVRQKARRLKRQLEADGQTLDLVLVDYLQLMDGDGRESRQQDVTKISRSLKILAKELKCPVIALSQLSRQPEGRTANKHRPILSDLRESGSIEQDADVVAFVYREEMYPNADGTVDGVNEGELIVAKQRNGPTGTVRLTFNKESTKFLNHVAEY